MTNTAALPRLTTLDRLLVNFAAIPRNRFKKCIDDSESFSSLVDAQLEQSEKIQLGTRMERFLTKIILAFAPTLKNIKEKNDKGKHETDHLFMDVDANIIYYAEIKSNLNLDTEKSVATEKKCLAVVENLKTKYPQCQIRMFLVSLRHLEAVSIKRTTHLKYKTIRDNIVGVREYLQTLGIPSQHELETEETYKKFINDIVAALKYSPT